jgi:glycosyltransferase involved in cell wall biosynthesis
MFSKFDETPLVSVAMTVYNGERYLRKAIQSILTQTLENFEFIIINDGSTDNTAEILKSYQDPRMKVIHQENTGVSISINRGLKLCRGKYIARMDADDISLPERLNLQVDFLERNSDYVMVGTGVVVIDEKDKVLSKFGLSSDDLGIKWVCLFDSPFAQSSVMIRKDAIVRANYYKEGVDYFVEDYDLWSRIVYIEKVANLKDVVHQYRDNPQGISRSNKEAQERQALQISFNNINSLINDPSFDMERAFVLHCLRESTAAEHDFNPEQIMVAIKDANRIQKEFIQKYGGGNTKNTIIKNEMQKIRMGSMHYLANFRTQKGAYKLIMQSLMKDNSYFGQLRYWKAIFALLLGRSVYNRIKSLITLPKSISRRLKRK